MTSYQEKIYSLIKKGYKTKSAIKKITGDSTVKVQSAINNLQYQYKIIQGNDIGKEASYTISKGDWFDNVPSTIEEYHKQNKTLKLDYNEREKIFYSYNHMQYKEGKAV